MKVLATVDCDFAGYDPLYAHRCALDDGFADDLARTRDLLGECAGGRGMFLIHTSPFVRRAHRDLFYTDDRYLSFWKECAARGFALGIHPHEDEPDGSAYYYYYPDHMETVLRGAQEHLQRAGLAAAAVRCGYCAGNERLFPVLTRLGLRHLLDNMGGDFPEVYSHWAGAPEHPYRPSADARTRPGDVPVWVWPIGFDAASGLNGWRSLIPEALTDRELKTLWGKIGRQRGPVTLLIHAHAVRTHGAKIRAALQHLNAHGAEWLARPEGVDDDRR